MSNYMPGLHTHLQKKLPAHVLQLRLPSNTQHGSIGNVSCRALNRGVDGCPQSMSACCASALSIWELSLPVGHSTVSVCRASQAGLNWSSWNSSQLSLEYYLLSR